MSAISEYINWVEYMIPITKILRFNTINFYLYISIQLLQIYYTRYCLIIILRCIGWKFDIPWMVFEIAVISLLCWVLVDYKYLAWTISHHGWATTKISIPLSMRSDARNASEMSVTFNCNKTDASIEMKYKPSMH